MVPLPLGPLLRQRRTEQHVQPCSCIDFTWDRPTWDYSLGGFLGGLLLTRTMGEERKDYLMHKVAIEVSKFLQLLLRIIFVVVVVIVIVVVVFQFEWKYKD